MGNAVYYMETSFIALSLILLAFIECIEMRRK